MTTPVPACRLGVLGPFVRSHRHVQQQPARRLGRVPVIELQEPHEQPVLVPPGGLDGQGGVRRGRPTAGTVGTEATGALPAAVNGGDVGSGRGGSPQAAPVASRAIAAPAMEIRRVRGDTPTW